MTETGLNRRFRHNLKTEREQQGISQAELSRRLIDAGWTTLGHQTTLHRVESGARPVKLDEAGAIADALGLDLEAMLKSSDEYVFSRAMGKLLASRNQLRQLAVNHMDAQYFLWLRLKYSSETLGDDEKDKAQQLIDETPGEAAMSGIRLLMPKYETDDYPEFHRLWREERERENRERHQQRRKGNDDAQTEA